MPTPTSHTLDKGLHLLEAMIDHGGDASVSELARTAGLRPSTAHRLMVTLQRRGFVSRAARGRYLPGPALMRLGRVRDLHGVLREVSRPILERLALATGLTAHLGVFEGDMVTYLVKAAGGAEVLTQEGMQLEAYCSGIGKALLAGLPLQEQARYLDAGPFVRLTPNTIIDPAALREALLAVLAKGYAIDDSEIDPNLRCLAAPVWAESSVCAAVSISATLDGRPESMPDRHLPALLQTARAIEAALTRPQPC